MSDKSPYPNERILEDDYPIHAGYIYLFDGEPLRARVTTTVGRMKEETGVQVIRNCDIGRRNLWDQTI